MIYFVSAQFITTIDSKIIQLDPTGTNGGTSFVNIINENPPLEKSQKQRDCEKLSFCWHDSRCYGSGIRITIEPEYKNKPLSWLNESYLYCEVETKSKFVPQKLTGEICENDFQCQSNKCSDRKCKQKEGIKITEKYGDSEIMIRNLFFREKELFHFSGLNKNYSVGLGTNGSDFALLINNNTYTFKNKTIQLDNNSQVILNNIYFDNGVANANITLTESINSFNNMDKLLEKNDKGVQKVENKVKITGDVIKTENEILPEKNMFIKIANWFSNLFK